MVKQKWKQNMIEFGHNLFNIWYFVLKSGFDIVVFVNLFFPLKFSLFDVGNSFVSHPLNDDQNGIVHLRQTQNLFRLCSLYLDASFHFNFTENRKISSHCVQISYFKLFIIATVMSKLSFFWFRKRFFSLFLIALYSHWFQSSCAKSCSSTFNSIRWRQALSDVAGVVLFSQIELLLEVNKM